MRTWVGVVLASAMASGAARAQEAGPATVEAMRSLAFLVGEWEGEAWTQTGPGQRLTFRQTESVRFSTSGHVLFIEGAGWERAPDGTERLAFNAAAILTHEPSAGYTMRSALMEGRTGEFTVVPSDSGFTWGFETPQGGKVRYAMRLTPEGAWRETGEFSADGTSWQQFFEMVVRRVP